MKTAQEYANIILAAVHEDMKQPFPWGKQIPRDVGSWSRVHDFCDANGYIIDYLDPDWDAEHPLPRGSRFMDESYQRLVNETLDLVDARLRIEALPDK